MLGVGMLVVILGILVVSMSTVMAFNCLVAEMRVLT